MAPTHVLAVASEIFPLIKTGGLADVAGALPKALIAQDILTRSIVPAYPGLRNAVTVTGTTTLPDILGWEGRLVNGSAAGLDLLLLDIPELFDRPGGPYVDTSGRDWPDNVMRFAALGRAAADVALGAIPGYAPDVVHAHDWQAGLTHAYLACAHGARRPGRIFTIHNLAFQGQFSPVHFPRLRLPQETFGVEGVEYHGEIGFLKAGLHYADRITTVSPRYATEIRTPESGMGLDGLIRARGAQVRGILNGIDTDEWDPATDPHLAAPFDAHRIEARAANKTDLRSRFGLDQDDSPVFGVVSRLTWQKGLDLLLECLPTLLGTGAQLAILGSGDTALESGFHWAATAHQGRVGCIIGYDEAMSRRLQAGADALLVPSRFEPCGLTQLCALRYGAVPVVARVGGLADTIIDANPAALARHAATGIQFAPVTVEMLRTAIERTVDLYRRPAIWKTIQANGMASDVSWRGPAREYADLYRDVLPVHR